MLINYKDFLGGTIGGIIGTITSHPFDTIKNRIQTNGVLVKDIMIGDSHPIVIQTMTTTKTKKQRCDLCFYVTVMCTVCGL